MEVGGFGRKFRGVPTSVEPGSSLVFDVALALGGLWAKSNSHSAYIGWQESGPRTRRKSGCAVGCG